MASLASKLNVIQSKCGKNMLSILAVFFLLFTTTATVHAGIFDDIGKNICLWLADSTAVFLGTIFQYISSEIIVTQDFTKVKEFQELFEVMKNVGLAFAGCLFVVSLINIIIENGSDFLGSSKEVLVQAMVKGAFINFGAYFMSQMVSVCNLSTQYILSSKINFNGDVSQQFKNLILSYNPDQLGAVDSIQMSLIMIVAMMTFGVGMLCIAVFYKIRYVTLAFLFVCFCFIVVLSFWDDSYLEYWIKIFAMTMLLQVFHAVAIYLFIVISFGASLDWGTILNQLAFVFVMIYVIPQLVYGMFGSSGAIFKGAMGKLARIKVSR